MRDVLGRVARRSVVIAAVLTAGAFVVGGLNAALGVVGGATLALMSFLMLRRGVERLAGPPATATSRRRGFGLVIARYALLALAAYVMIARLRLHPIGLLVGASSIAAAVMAEAIQLLEPRR